uniref:Putative secreted protein n=1 Tax=Ixodes ricinus TaxID=34613 RepID=A0A6B0U3Y8_IXORI
MLPWVSLTIGEPLVMMAHSYWLLTAADYVSAQLCVRTWCKRSSQRNTSTFCYGTHCAQMQMCVGAFRGAREAREASTSFPPRRTEHAGDVNACSS